MKHELPERRKNWRLRWLSSLRELTSSSHQLRWLDKKIRNPHWSYVEFTSCYFDDLGLSQTDYNSVLKAGFISHEEMKIVEDFHSALKAYKPPNGPSDAAAILNDTRWQEIVIVGLEAILNLETLLKDPIEISILHEPTQELTEGDFTWGLPISGEELYSRAFGIVREILNELDPMSLDPGKPGGAPDTEYETEVALITSFVVRDVKNLRNKAQTLIDEIDRIWNAKFGQNCVYSAVIASKIFEKLHLLTQKQ